jgi:DNA-binding NarL/FixJ family response regulator
MRVLIADDHVLFRSGCRLMLEELEPGVEVIETADFGGALSSLETNPDIDLLIIDLVMPGMESVTSIDRLRKLAPDVPLVMCSAFERAADAREALRLGAAGYVPKSSPKQVIMRSLELILSGGTYFPPELLSGESEDRVPSGPSGLGEAPMPDIDVKLTRRQRDVLQLMSEGRTNREIAQALGLAEGTVKVHVAAVLKALNVSNRTQAVLAATRPAPRPAH